RIDHGATRALPSDARTHQTGLHRTAQQETQNTSHFRDRTLAVPLGPPQIEAACRLHETLEGWRVSDAALLRLHHDRYGFDPEACLLKAVAVNALYGTQVYAIVRMAKHAHKILNQGNLASAGPELVEAIATLPANDGEKARQFVSFAAKFCHLFVDEERFPIYDDAARTMLVLHLGVYYRKDSKRPYAAFCKNFAALRELSKFRGPSRNLDRYLWIAGMYRRWSKGSRLVNGELRRLFTKPNKKEAAVLEALLPPDTHIKNPNLAR
ncbi:MAG: hypothetical protein ACT4PS_10735, partial [Betaproteobacteria bacterium]